MLGERVVADAWKGVRVLGYSGFANSSPVPCSVLGSMVGILGEAREGTGISFLGLRVFIFTM